VSLWLLVLACVLPSPARCFAPALRAKSAPRAPPLTPRGASGSLEPQSVDNVDFRPESEHTWAQMQVFIRALPYRCSFVANVHTLPLGLGVWVRSCDLLRYLTRA